MRNIVLLILCFCASLKLASALLFQGKYGEALQVYSKWKDKPWKDDRFETFGKVFLEDLKELEEAGIKHPDVEKARRFLKNEN